MDSIFVDVYDGLYQSSNVTVPAPVPLPVLNCPSYVSASMLQFACIPCSVGSYAVAGGHSDGTPAGAVNPTCLPCPTGGQCLTSGVAANPGFWGAADNSTGVVSFVGCPSGYCCAQAPCGGMGVCAGNRVGGLCGACEPGYVEGLGSPDCVPAASCAGDAAPTWVALVAGILVAAALQVTTVSGVWLAAGVPTGKMKLVIYFAQVCVCGQEGGGGLHACCMSAPFCFVHALA